MARGTTSVVGARARPAGVVIRCGNFKSVCDSFFYSEASRGSSRVSKMPSSSSHQEAEDERATAVTTMSSSSHFDIGQIKDALIS